MRRTFRAVSLGAASTIVGAAGYRLLSARRGRRPNHSGRRHVITVFRPLEKVRDNLPETLNRRGDFAVDLRAAPGGRGTEISAQASAGSVSHGDLRRALRESRSLLEVGEVLQPGGPTTEPTMLNRPLRAVTRRGRAEGLL
jgi:hypothetical protein